MTAARVLVVGLDPAKIQGWDPEPVQAAMARGRARFGDHGIEATGAWWHSTRTPKE